MRASRSLEGDQVREYSGVRSAADVIEYANSYYKRSETLTGMRNPFGTL